MPRLLPQLGMLLPSAGGAVVRQPMKVRSPDSVSHQVSRTSAMWRLLAGQFGSWDLGTVTTVLVDLLAAVALRHGLLGQKVGRHVHRLSRALFMVEGVTGGVALAWEPAAALVSRTGRFGAGAQAPAAATSTEKKAFHRALSTAAGQVAGGRPNTPPTRTGVVLTAAVCGGHQQVRRSTAVAGLVRRPPHRLREPMLVHPPRPHRHSHPGRWEPMPRWCRPHLCLLRVRTPSRPPRGAPLRPPPPPRGLLREPTSLHWPLRWHHPPRELRQVPAPPRLARRRRRPPLGLREPTNKSRRLAHPSHCVRDRPPSGH